MARRGHSPNNPGPVTHRILRRALAGIRRLGKPLGRSLLPLVLVAVSLPATQAQQTDLPTDAPDSAPVPHLPTPLGSDAPPAHTAAPRPQAASVPAGADASASLPASDDAQTPNTGLGDNASQTLFGRGKTSVPSLTRRIPYSFSLSVGGVYDDNTGLSSRETGGDFYFTISPSFVLGLDNLVSAKGNYLHFIYTPTISLYVTQTKDSSIQHLIGLETALHLGQFVLSLRQDVQILDGSNTAATNPGPGAVLLPGQTAGSNPIFTTGTIDQTNLDVSGRSSLNIYESSVTIGYSYSEKTELNAGLSYTVNDYSGLISSQNLSASLFADYSYSIKTSFGLGVTAGRTFVDPPSPDQLFQEFNLRGSYRYSSKLGFAGTIGLEFVESDGRSGVTETPVFSLSADYQLSDTTSFSLSASRSQQSSAVLAAQNFDTTSLSIRINQFVNSRVSAGLTLAYENSQYVSEADNVRANRNENFVTIEPTVNITLRPGLSLNLFYDYRKSNSSGAESRSFSNNQLGFSVGYAF